MARLGSAFSAFSCAIFFLWLSCSSASAHEVRPAYLELREAKADTYDVLWKVPGRGDDMRLGLYVEFPADSKNLTEPRGTMINNALTERWSVRRAGGLTGGTIRIAGLSATMTDVLVRLERLDGTSQITRLTPAAPAFVVAAAPRALEVAGTYTVLGIEHILSGIDHLLFILALILICLGPGAPDRVSKVRVLRLSLDPRHWTLLKTVTAFTLSHSLTLTLAALGYIHVPQRPVEAAIALSIVFVAAEILHGRQGRPGLTARAPWIVAFTFGLMHGLGFASGLSEAGLPDGHIPTALLFFSLGVEMGHFLFIGVVLSLIAVGRWAIHRFRLSTLLPQYGDEWRASSADKSRLPSRAERDNSQLSTFLRLLPPYAIGSLAMFWVIQRIAAF